MALWNLHSQAVRGGGWAVSWNDMAMAVLGGVHPAVFLTVR